MRALIVDDEPLARKGVLLRLRRFKDIQVVGECGDGASAITKILTLAPDLIFLDVQMPEMDGFEVLRALPAEAVPAVIFLTAYEQHAVRAFDVHALDYLVKPVDDERFLAAVNRALKLGQSQFKNNVLRLLDDRSGNYVSRFPVRTGQRIQIVQTEEIDWISASGDYAELHARGKIYLIRETMNSLQQKLSPAMFVRIHRSRIIRGDFIRELRLIDNREYIVKLSDGSEHRSSRTYADQLEGWLE
ncbi:MAG: DNA-binding response regulator [Blastocatellia bacterium]|nr:MAG: DNA-binding response regulator [Blastocatellia bacterium]